MNDITNTEVLVPVTVSPELDEALKKEIAEGTPVIIEGYSEVGSVAH